MTYHLKQYLTVVSGDECMVDLKEKEDTRKVR